MLTEAYLEPSQTFTMELFCKNAPSYINVWLGSKYASGSLDKPCEMAPLNSFVLHNLRQN